jgi:hypothetical protein
MPFASQVVSNRTSSRTDSDLQFGTIRPGFSCRLLHDSTGALTDDIPLLEYDQIVIFSRTSFAQALHRDHWSSAETWADAVPRGHDAARRDPQADG